MKKLSFLFVLGFGLVISSCKNDKTATDAAATTATSTPQEGAVTATDATTAPATTTTEATPMPAAGETATPDVAKPTGPITSIVFEKPEYDYGTIKDGEKVKYNYKFKNTGKEPLIITDAKGSCGCTVPNWPREPIAPGKSAEINVEFDSKGKGSDEGAPQTKRVTITANTDPVQTYLTIKGIVKK
jgi:hypothetical protein